MENHAEVDTRRRGNSMGEDALVVQALEGHVVYRIRLIRGTIRADGPLVGDLTMAAAIHMAVHLTLWPSRTRAVHTAHRK